MNTIPHGDELPYRFIPPRPSRTWLALTRPVRQRMLRREHRVDAIRFLGLERLRGLIGRGDGVLIAPNHSDRADGFVVLELGRELGVPLTTMAAHGLFAGDAGLRYFLFPRLGVFPVDRDGTGLTALRAGVDVLAAGKSPLVLFPEGEIYYVNDRVTPLRDGVSALATMALKNIERASPGKTIWMVPLGFKYRFLGSADPVPALCERMSALESRLTWAPTPHLSLVERIYRFAQGLLALKEIEFFGEPSAGSVRERVERLRDALLERLELRIAGRVGRGSVPERVKEARRAAMDAIAKSEANSERARELRDSIGELFVVLQSFSYPGDYVRSLPTRERIAETLTKFEQDLFGVHHVIPRGPREAIIAVGEPIDVRAEAGAGKARDVVPRLTAELQRRIQGVLDGIGPGVLVDPEGEGAVNPTGPGDRTAPPR